MEAIRTRSIRNGAQRAPRPPRRHVCPGACRARSVREDRPSGRRSHVRRAPRPKPGIGSPAKPRWGGHAPTGPPGWRCRPCRVKIDVEGERRGGLALRMARWRRPPRRCARGGRRDRARDGGRHHSPRSRAPSAPGLVELRRGPLSDESRSPSPGCRRRADRPARRPHGPSTGSTAVLGRSAVAQVVVKRLARPGDGRSPPRSEGACQPSASPPARCPLPPTSPPSALRGLWQALLRGRALPRARRAAVPFGAAGRVRRRARRRVEQRVPSAISGRMLRGARNAVGGAFAATGSGP